MPAILPEEKTKDAKRYALEVKVTDDIRIIFAVEGTPASADCSIEKIESGAPKSKAFSINDMTEAGGRVSWRLPVDAEGIYALSATVFCIPNDWEGMLKITVNGDERYRDYETHHMSDDGNISKIGLALILAIVVGGSA